VTEEFGPDMLCGQLSPGDPVGLRIASVTCECRNKDPQRPLRALNSLRVGLSCAFGRRGGLFPRAQRGLPSKCTGSGCHKWLKDHTKFANSAAARLATIE
jgi:hypothetical protein